MVIYKIKKLNLSILLTIYLIAFGALADSKNKEKVTGIVDGNGVLLSWVTISAFIKGMENLSKPTLTCSPSEEDYPSSQELLKRIGTRKFAPRFCDSVEKFCVGVRAICYSQTQNSRCKLFLKKQKKREGSHILKFDAYAHAYSYFESLINGVDQSSKNFIRTCCQGDKKCSNQFKKTKLKILHTDNSDTTRPIVGDCFYVVAKGIFKSKVQGDIFMGENSFLGCLSKECIEYRVLHELGHSCQYSRHLEALKEERNLTWAEVKQDYRDLSCLKNAIKMGWQDSNWTGDILSWHEEAFADNIFSRYQNPAHYAETLCSNWENPYDREHMNIRGYLHCLILDNRSKLCEPKKDFN